MKKYFDILKKCPLFKGIDEKDLSGLLGCLGAKVSEFDKKYTVFSEGSTAKYIGIVLSGSVQMTRVDFDGNRTIVSNAEESEMFGEAFACAEINEIPVTVIANEASEIMFIDCQRIMHSCSNACGFHQQMVFNLMKELATKNLNFYQKIEITSRRSTKEKLMAYLDFQAKKHKSNRFFIPFDRQELADYLEVDRSGLSSEISKLKKAGVIDNKKNRFELIR